MSLLASLPAPRQEFGQLTVQAPTSTSVALASRREPPPYLRRQGFIPRRADDFCDGGAFPEVHVAQYPLEMGRPDQSHGSGKTLAVTTNADGELNFDAIVKQGRNRDKFVHASHKDLVPKIDDLNEANMERPSEEEVEATMQATLAALSKVVTNKIQVANPKSLPTGTQPGAPTYIKYTPSQQGAEYASGAKQRIVKVQDLPVDPLEPPKFRHTKVPRGAGSPPVPVMHSPPRPLTKEDQSNWKIPPCVSNWKNAKGYTIPLDKRLAADGRGLLSMTVSDKFAPLSDALVVAEMKAREAVAMRNKVQKELLMKEKEKKERELRDLALKARMEHAGVSAAARSEGVAASDLGPLPGPPPGPPPPPNETREEREERLRREEIRSERKRERERERRLEAKEAHGSKKSKLTRDRDRDVSEKVALGMANVAGGQEVMYDSRLFNQEQGMASGFGAEDNYNLYDKPLFQDRSALYRPKAVDSDGEGGEGKLRTDKFKPDKGFKGAEGAAGTSRGGPVEFERRQEEADPFGLDQFLGEVKAGGKKKKTLDGIGRSGGMNAGGGGGSYDDYAGGGSGRSMQFTSARG